MFFTVIVLTLLVVFTRWATKDRPVGVSVTGKTPDPVKLAVCGLLRALSVTVRVPVRVPRAVGVNLI